MSDENRTDPNDDGRAWSEMDLFDLANCVRLKPARRKRTLILAPMLGPFDWYSAIEIGIAAVVVGIIVLISWWQRPPRG